VTAVDGHAADVIRELALDAAIPTSLALGEYHTVVTPAGVTQIDLTGDKWRDFPRRKQGTVTVRDVAAFAHYYRRHADPDSEVFADHGKGTVTAVLDAHLSAATDAEFQARWQQHRLILQLEKTTAWLDWLAHDRDLMPQDAFAEFIEEHATDVATGGAIEAGDLLDVAQFFQAHTEVAFTSGKRLQDGQTQLMYQETTTASTRTAAGELQIPGEFEVAIAPYEDCVDRAIRVRLRYRLNKNTGAVVFGYFLDNPVRREEAAVEEIAGKVAAELGVTVMHGTPA